MFAVKSTQNAESKGIIYLPAMVDYHKRKKWTKETSISSQLHYYVLITYAACTQSQQKKTPYIDHYHWPNDVFFHQNLIVSFFFNGLKINNQKDCKKTVISARLVQDEHKYRRFFGVSVHCLIKWLWESCSNFHLYLRLY